MPAAISARGSRPGAAAPRGAAGGGGARAAAGGARRRAHGRRVQLVLALADDLAEVAGRDQTVRLHLLEDPAPALAALECCDLVAGHHGGTGAFDPKVEPVIVYWQVFA